MAGLRRHNGRHRPDRRHGIGREDQDRHRRRLSALQQPDRRRQAGRLRHRHRQRAVRPDEGRVRIRRAGLGRHHSRPPGRQVRRHRRLDEHHRGAQEAGRLHQQILYHAAGRGCPEGQRPDLDRAGRHGRQDDRRAGFHHPVDLRAGLLHAGWRRREAVPDAGRSRAGHAERPSRRDHLGQVRPDRLDEDRVQRLLQADRRRGRHRNRDRHRRAARR